MDEAKCWGWSMKMRGPREAQEALIPVDNECCEAIKVTGRF